MSWKFKNWLPFEEGWNFSLIFQLVALSEKTKFGPREEWWISGHTKDQTNLGQSPCICSWL